MIGMRSCLLTCKWLLRTAAWLFLAVSGNAETDLCQQARDLFQSHHWAESAASFSECEQRSPGKTDALLYRGKALVNLGDFAAASSSLDAYAVGHPASDDVLYLLAYVRFRQDKPKDSLELLNRAAKLRDPEASDLKIAALDYVLLNDFTSAAKYLEMSLQMNPKDVEARYHLGRVRYQQNKFDQAIAAFEGVLDHDPTNVKAQDNLGLCFEGENRTPEALAAYGKAIELERASTVRNAQPYIDMGKLLNTLNRPGEAVSLLSRALTIQPNSATGHYELGRALFLSGKFEEASSHLEEAVRLDPENGSQHYLLGRVYARMGRSEQATAEFKKTEELIHQKNLHSGGMATGR
jgi:tetratricopeptide (TPR) repeat protein